MLAANHGRADAEGMGGALRVFPLLADNSVLFLPNAIGTPLTEIWRAHVAVLK